MSLSPFQSDSSARNASVLGSFLGAVEDDPLMGPIFREKVSEMEQEAAESAGIPATAHAVLYFSGAPVLGTDGIDAIFAVKALESYQQMVRTQYAFRKLGVVATRAIQPSAPESRLLLCGTPRGSFGLELRSAPTQDMIQATEMQAVVQSISLGLRAAAADDESFGVALDELSPRVFTRMKRFYADLHNHGATVRVRSGDMMFALTSEQIRSAKDRLDTLVTKSETEHIAGTFGGLTLQSGQFDFMAASGELISGRIDANVSMHAKEEMQNQFFQVACIGRFKKVTVTSHASVKVRRQLLELLPAAFQPQHVVAEQ